MSNPFRIAERAFRETLEELDLTGTEPEFADPGQLGQRAALLVIAGIIWRCHIGPLLDVSQVQQLMRVRTARAVRGFVERRRLLALPTETGEHRYPIFQFGTTGRPHRILPKVLEIFAESDASPYTVASWFATPQDGLDEKSPVEWLHLEGDPRRVEQAARRTAERLKW